MVLHFTGSLTQEEKLDKFMNFISDMDSGLETVSEHAAAMEKFWAGQGDELYNLTTRSRRVGFNGGSQEILAMQSCLQEWQEVKSNFRNFLGAVRCWTYFRLFSCISADYRSARWIPRQCRIDKPL
jgi:hypothetical protein